MRNKIEIERHEKKETKKEETYLDIEKEKAKNDGEENVIPKILEVLNNLTRDVQNLKNVVENQNKIINIMNDIDNQKDIYYKTTINGINKKVKLIMNSYKILYMRKLANLLLQKIYKKYSHCLGKTYIEYGNKKEKKKVDVIAVFPGIKKLDTVESYNIIISDIIY